MLIWNWKTLSGHRVPRDSICTLTSALYSFVHIKKIKTEYVYWPCMKILILSEYNDKKRHVSYHAMLIVLRPSLPAVLETCRYNLLLCVQGASGILYNIVCESCWQTPSIKLVELNQLQEVIEFGHATVQRITNWISQWVKHLQKNKMAKWTFLSPSEETLSVSMIDGKMWSIYGMITLKEQHVPLPLYPPQIPHVQHHNPYPLRFVVYKAALGQATTAGTKILP